MTDDPRIPSAIALASRLALAPHRHPADLYDRHLDAKAEALDPDPVFAVLEEDLELLAVIGLIFPTSVVGGPSGTGLPPAPTPTPDVPSLSSAGRSVSATQFEHGDERLPERFWTKTVVRESGCWEWTGALQGSGPGYGVIRPTRQRIHVRAHRFAYEALVGPIPEGLQIDHLCRNTHCVNPAHLEPVTGAENTLRGTAPSAVNARKTHCVNGHPFDEENTALTSQGRRVCRACARARNESKRSADWTPPAPAFQGMPTAKVENQNSRKTHCKNGHPLVEGNLRTNRGWRECLTCRREYRAASRARAAEPTYVSSLGANDAEAA